MRIERLPIPFDTEILPSGLLSLRAALVNGVDHCLKPGAIDMEGEHNFSGKHIQEFRHFALKNGHKCINYLAEISRSPTSRYF